MPGPSPDDRRSPSSTTAASPFEMRVAAIEELPGIDLVAESVAIETMEGVERRRLPRLAWLAIGWLGLIVLAAILAPVLPIDDPNEIPLPATCLSQGPSAEHPLGCDSIGRDLLSRNIWGARSSLIVAVGANMIGFLIGGGLGLIAGYRRGRFDNVAVSGFDVLLAFPQLILALTLVAVFAGGEDATYLRRIVVMVFAIGIVAIPIVGRISRANTLSWAQREFVMAARAQGAKDGRMIVREVLPNVLPAMFSIALLGVAVAIVAEGGLSVFGLGIPLPTPSWGNIISTGVKDIEAAPHIVFSASLFIFLTVLALNYLGDVVREYFDVRESAL